MDDLIKTETEVNMETVQTAVQTDVGMFSVFIYFVGGYAC